jgi:4-amino-4-deoxy-L-arabinose transferase-like glycosyltransferase
MNADLTGNGASRTELFGPKPKGIAAWLWLAALAVAYLVLNIAFLENTVRKPDLAKKMSEKDSRQYIEIAQDFARGDFSMSYVRNMPHRQPLYPLLLAPAVKVWGDNLFALGWVNILVGLVLLVCLYQGLLLLFGSLPVAVLTSLAYIGNPFMVDKISCRIMTEPSHALCLTLLIFFYLAYLRNGKARWFCAAGAMAGLDYLSRPNGLFVMAAMTFTFFCHDAWALCRQRQPEEPDRGTWFRSRALAYAGGAFFFLLTATPSWIPRYRFFHHPFFHGYLSNFMWVDSYEQAHTGQAESVYTWRDYVGSHSLHDFAVRLGEGLWRVYLDIPRHTEHVRILYFLAVIGVAIAVVKRQREFWILAIFLFIQLFPVVWTIVANSGPRVSYGTLFPFELFFAALTLATILPFAGEWLAARRNRSAAEG